MKQILIILFTVFFAARTTLADVDCDGKCFGGPGVKIDQQKLRCEGSEKTCICVGDYTRKDSVCVPTTPAISVSVTETIVEKGKKLVLNCGPSYPTGTPLTYKWKKESKPLGGKESQNLIIANVKQENAGNYTCTIEATDSVRIDSAVITVKVTEPTDDSSKTTKGGVAQVMGSTVLVLMAVCVPTFL